jgi:sulfate transport system ATP-binding protein
MEVADRVVVMNRGRIEQQGAPDEVYDRPATPFVLQFLGDVNLFHGRIGHLPAGEAGGAAAAGRAGEPATAVAADALEEISFVRPHELEIVAEAGEGTWPVVLSHTLTVGPNTRIEFRREDAAGFVDVELPRDTYVALRGQLGLEPGARVHLRPRRVTRFAAATLGAAALATAVAPAAATPAGVAIDQRLLDYYAG